MAGVNTTVYLMVLSERRGDCFECEVLGDIVDATTGEDIGHANGAIEFVRERAIRLEVVSQRLQWKARGRGAEKG